jgi:hypothetical protein
MWGLSGPAEDALGGYEATQKWVKTDVFMDRALAATARSMDKLRAAYILMFHDCRDIEKDLLDREETRAIYSHYIQIQLAADDI